MPLSITLPNVRKLFISDPGFVMYEANLKGADAQVVAWEAEDENLKTAFREGVDIHVKNARRTCGALRLPLSLPTLMPAPQRGEECKHTVHGINYGCSPQTTAIQRGWLVREAERFHTRWLSLHPGIALWHNHIKAQLAKDKTIKNAFGFRRVFFDRLDGCFTKALAWIPQSTVALNTYHGALQLERKILALPPSHHLLTPKLPKVSSSKPTTHSTSNSQKKLRQLEWLSKKPSS